MRPILLRMLIGALPCAAGFSQSVRWDPPGGTLAVGQTTPLQLVFEECDPKGTPAPPAVDGLSLEYSGQSNNVSIVNGSYSQSVTCTYAALLKKKARVEIPSFEVDTSKGRLRVLAATFDPGTATIGSSGRALESAASSRLEADPTDVWAGEVFDLSYIVQAARSYAPDFGRGDLDWNPRPLVAEDWSAPEPYDDLTGAEPQTGLAFRTRAFIRRPGSYRLNPVNQLVNLSVGVTGFGFFQQRQYQQFSVTSSVPTVQVRPLPPAPAGFTGAVGDFKIASKVVPQSAAVGDPVTWTVELSGTGNWPDIAGLPPREVSKDFQVVQPRAKRSVANGKLFKATLNEDVVLIPTKPGTYELDPVRFTFFDPASGIYRTLTTAGASISVAASAAVPETAEAGGAGQAPPVSPAFPSGLPRDPLPPGGSATAPLEGGTESALLLAPFGALVGIWLWLARRRAIATDPGRPRREARDRLGLILERIHGAEMGSVQALDSRLPGLLAAWQRDCALFWGIEQAAPAAEALPDPAWAALWSEAERALYGPDGSLPADWASRARAVLAARAAPPFSIARLFQPRNLLPFLALALLGLAPPCAGAGASPAGAYARGDFPAAERAWRAEIARDPLSWSARHNLSLALAQQDRWDEAAAQASAAFVQNPGDASVRWQFALACEKAGFAPDPLAEFLVPGPLEWLARAGSPAAWQGVRAAAVWFGAAALGAMLAAAYGRWRGRRFLPACAAALGLALAVAAASTFCIRSYGLAADTGAAIAWRSSALRSIPTEADTSQRTVPLPAGSIGRADRTFLGWVRLAFENGQTGWVRREELVWIWR